MKSFIKSFLLILLILVSCFLIYKRYINVNNSKENTEKYTIKVINNRHNDLVYIMGNIYYYNVTANITIDSETHSLEEALKSELITIDELIENMEQKDVAFDGGSSTYIPKKGIVTYGNLVITKCSTLEGNNNIIISNMNRIDLCEIE